MNKAIENAIEQAGIAIQPQPMEADWRRYAELLEQTHSAQPANTPGEAAKGDAATRELALLMKKLSRTAMDVRADLEALLECRKCLESFEAGKVQRQMGEAEDAATKHDAETRRLLSELQSRRSEELQTLREKLHRLGQRKIEAQRAATRIVEIKRRGALVIAHLPNPDLKQLDI